MFLYYAFSTSPPQNQALNNELWSRGYPELAGQLDGGGGGFLVRRGRFILNPSGSGQGGEKEEGSYVSAGGMGQGRLNLGYILAQRRGFRLYPILGLGGSGAGITIQPTADRREVCFDLRGGGPLYNLGLGADFQIRIWRFSVLIGAQAGYQYAPITLALEADDTPNEKIKLRAGGPYLSFIFGAGINKQA